MKWFYAQVALALRIYFCCLALEIRNICNCGTFLGSSICQAWATICKIMSHLMASPGPLKARGMLTILSFIPLIQGLTSIGKFTEQVCEEFPWKYMEILTKTWENFELSQVSAISLKSKNPNPRKFRDEFSMFLLSRLLLDMIKNVNFLLFLCAFQAHYQLL